jgi:thymidylate synthase ThyX
MDTFNCSNGYEDLKVEICHVTHDNPFKLFWDWFRQTWLSLQDKEYDHTDKECLTAAIDVLNRRALPTPMEVLTFDIKISGLSRVALAQITRGRIGHCFNVESQMPQKIRHGATIPKNIYEHPLFGQRAQSIQDELTKLYDDMYAAGIPPQDCRYLTLHGQQTSLRWNVNFAALMGFFARRCENGLTDELNLVGRLVRRQLIDKFLDEVGNDKLPGSGWKYLIEKLDCMGGSKVCLNNDLVFGNTGRAKSAGDWVPSPTNQNLKPDYDFSKSAFYCELLEMNEDLLLPGEKEMIDDWTSIGFEGRLRKLDDK